VVDVVVVDVVVVVVVVSSGAGVVDAVVAVDEGAYGSPGCASARMAGTLSPT
jgi:hypothetical protein